MSKGTVSRGVVKDDDINPDGVRVVIDWDQMVVGAVDRDWETEP